LIDGPVATPEEPLPILVLRLDDPSVMHPIEAEAVTPDFARDYAFEIYPLLPLEAKTRYVYVVTVDALDANGHHIRPDPDLTARVTSTAPDAWRESLEPVLEHLSEELGIDRSEIAAIDFFTTQPTTDDLIAIRDLFDDGVLPVAEPAFENSPVFGLNTGVFPEGSPEFTTLVGSETSDYVAAVAVGSFPSFDFRFGSQRPFDPARVSAETMPTVNHLDFYMTIPKAPPPAGGYPITIFGHGLGGSGQNAIRMAEFTRDEPMMWIGISAVEHGRRGQVANFFNLANGFATREHFRQTIADFLQLQRMIRNATVSPFDLVDKNRIHYAGVSLGGIMGTLYMGVEPDVAVGMLSVPGGGLPRIINSVAIGDLIKPLLSLVSGVPLNDPLFPILFHGFQQVSQLVIDPADPINTAPFVIDPEKRLPRVPPKRILMHEGIVDDVVPNETTEALAAAMGLPDVKATLGCLDSAGCSGIWRFVMTEYGEEEDSGHGVTGILEEAMQQLARFLLSDGTEIIDASPRE
jgi:predicted esterase